MAQKNQQDISLRFPKKFLWGASISTHQVEGGNHNQWSVWELETAQLKASRAEYNYKHLPVWDAIKEQATKPSNYVSGLAADHYNRYESDFDIVESLHFNTLRSGIEWSRIEPEQGKFSQEALEHYQQYFNSLKKRGITPVVTLWHWTFPEWFAKKGGFTRRTNVRYFVRYVEYLLKELKIDLRYVITINEPTVYTAMSYHERRWPPEGGSLAQSFFVLQNLALAHKKAYRLIKKKYPNSHVGIAHNCAYFYAGDSSRLSTLVARLGHAFSNEYFINKVKRHQDFLGLNYYFANQILGTKVHNTGDERNDLGWDMQPDRLRPLLGQLYKKYKTPIIITESGVADARDIHRKWWIAQSIKAMNGALIDGVQLRGYIHWSLLDNFEWAEGFWPRFGLVEVDYATQKRRTRPSARWYGGVIKRLREQES